MMTLGNWNGPARNRPRRLFVLLRFLSNQPLAILSRSCSQISSTDETQRQNFFLSVRTPSFKDLEASSKDQGLLGNRMASNIKVHQRKRSTRSKGYRCAAAQPKNQQKIHPFVHLIHTCLYTNMIHPYSTDLCGFYYVSIFNDFPCICCHMWSQEFPKSKYIKVELDP